MSNFSPLPDTIPDHVPRSLVFDFDIWSMPPEFTSPIDYFKSVQIKRAPSIFYTPRNGGHWVLHRFEDTLEGYRDTEFFSNFPNGVPARQGAPTRLIPVEVDPPQHHKYRSVLFPLFSPAAVRRREPKIRALVKELMGKFVAQGRCDFARDVSYKLPTRIFVELLGLPIEDLPNILRMEHEYLRGESPDARRDGANAIFAYIAAFVPVAREQGHSEPIMAMANARDAEGRPWSHDEICNTTFLLYVAGLDTVANMMTYIWHRLACEKAARHHIASHLSEADQFIDELMRLGVPAVNARTVRSDGVFRGVAMKKGDTVLCVPTLANRDPEMFPEPDRVDLNRSNARHQVSFGAGIHRCVGANLARLEILIALQEWFRQIPEFALEKDVDLHAYCGNINGLGSLPLVWQPGASKASQ